MSLTNKIPEERRDTARKFKGETLTEQSHKDETDIRRIMRKARETGIVNHTSKYQGEYMDMATSLDFQEAQNLIASTNSMWETVPSDIRAQFDNEPGKFVEFMQDNANYQAIADMGLDTSHLTPPELTKPADAGAHVAPTVVTSSAPDDTGESRDPQP